jgi:hypothetical protein
MAASLNPDPKHNANLETVIAREAAQLPTQMLATPAAADCQGSYGGGQGRSLTTDIHNHKKTTGETGLLNPYFVEMMMGFPQGWTLKHEPHD